MERDAGIPDAFVSDIAIRTLTYLAVIVHVVIGVLAWRRGSAVPLLPIINLATAACVVAYGLNDWYGIITRGITWYATDQLLPLYALAVCVFSILSLAGKVVGTPVHWTIFTLQLLVLIAAALFFTFVKFTRMI